MVAVDLVFEGAPLHTGHLVFGDDGGSDTSDAVISGSIDAGMPVLAGAAALGIVATGAIDIGMPVLAGAAIYFTDTARPLVAQARARWQDTDPQHERTAQRWQDAGVRTADTCSRYQQAAALHDATRSAWADADRSKREARAVRFQDADRVHVGAKVPFADAVRGFRPTIHSRYQVGDGIHVGAVGRYRDATRGIAGQHRTRYQDADARHEGVQSVVGSGKAVHRGWGTRYQDAWSPRPGRYAGPVIPPVEPCYIPSGHLVFDAPWSADTHLVFFCERHVPPPEPGATVIVPVRRVYVVENHIALTRVDNGAVVEADAFAMSLDADSWTWSWSASLPASALSLITPDGSGDPVELLATINGVGYRLCAESYSRERSFARASVRVQGRGRGAILDAPYAPTMNHAGLVERTAQQLMLDALTINGVPIGWDVDWNLTDWLVPGGSWTHQGSYISAALDIARAAGGIVQPHRTDATLRILPRYPAVPWEWDTLTPDFELPSAVVAVEGIEWRTLPAYNRVFVSGTTAGGALGQVTRAGTAGDLVAPMVTHSLMTHADALRQRGLAELSNTGRQALVSLRAPVLAETGIIQPGALVRYVDGGTTRLGVVRSTAVSWARPTLRQTLGIETHVS